MKVLRKDLVYLFLQAKRNLPKPIIMMMINPVDKKRQRWAGTHPQEVKGK
jgi:hypothetical protein